MADKEQDWEDAVVDGIMGSNRPGLWFITADQRVTSFRRGTRVALGHLDETVLFDVLKRIRRTRWSVDGGAAATGDDTATRAPVMPIWHMVAPPSGAVMLVPELVRGGRK